MTKTIFSLLFILMISGCTSNPTPTYSEPDRRSGDQRFWEDMKSRNKTLSYNLYLSTFPNGKYVKQAHEAIAILDPRLARIQAKADKAKADKLLAKKHEDIAWEKGAKQREIDALKWKNEAPARAKEARLARIKEDKKREAAEKKRVADRIEKQACVLRDSKWLYLSTKCAGKYAHGKGRAETESGLSFVGTFKDGYRINGELFVNDELKYDGPISDGRPHGEGVCINNGEPEACKFYKGKRIDALYKQRIEFAIQSEKLDKFEREQKKLARQQDKILANQQRIESQRQNSRPVASSSNNGNTASDMIMDTIQKKATEKAVDMIFDELF